MNISIVAGGPENYLPDLKNHAKSDVVWAGADKGAVYLLKRGIIPHYGFGDFDSIDKNELDLLKNESIKVFRYQEEKDETDLEIALTWAISQNPNSISIYGATGGRADHMLANMQLLNRTLKAGVPARIIDVQNEISIYHPGIYNIEKDINYKYVSFLPFSSEVKGITLQGFKYPLDNGILTSGSSLCVSNELVNKNGTYSFSSGILMMVKSRD